MSDFEIGSHVKVNAFAAAYDKVSGMPTDELRGELVRALTVTAESLMYLAAVWKELENRGADLSELRSGIGAYVPMIAAGHLAAEAVVAFAGRKRLLDKVSSLPIERQVSLAQGEKVEIVEINDSGDPEERLIPPVALRVDQIDRVFDEARVRSPQEQKRLLKPSASKEKDKPITFKVTRDEHARLKAAAADQETSIQSLCRQAIKKAGLL